MYDCDQSRHQREPSAKSKLSEYSCSTFPKSSDNSEKNLWAVFLQILTGHKRKRVNQHGLGRHLLTSIIVALGLCAITIFFNVHHTSKFPLPFDSHEAPALEWYHYHYFPKQTSTSRATLGTRNLLVVQMTGPGPLGDMADITSRPNRAYSKQWGIDYLRYSGSQGPSRECVNKAVVLDTLLKRQEQSFVDEAKGSSSVYATKRTYDSVLILPADSIITDLDFDLLSLLPKNKLLAVAGSVSQNVDFDALEDLIRSESGILMWNLNHPQSRTAAKLWMENLLHPRLGCTGSNELGYLMSAVDSVAMTDDHEGVSDLVQILEETTKGFVSPRVIKFVPSFSAESRINNLAKNVYETTATLEADSDSVCYRYYPKCEVL